jgi:hypothetical protein
MGISLRNKVALADLQKIVMPERTDTYCPISHYDLAQNIQKVSTDLLEPKGYVFVDAVYGTAREGQRVFGLFRYKNGGEETGMAIGWRNSYDKSMSAAVAIGANVFVCDNLCIHGDITIMRRHTKNIEDDLVQSIINALYNATTSYEHFMETVKLLKDVGISDRLGYEMLGVLVGEGVLTPTIFNEAMREWKKPSHESFQPRNAWSLYNAITHGLKQAPPHKVFEMHRGVHDVFVAEFVAQQPDSKEPF